ncbi:hypothetical protein BC831DRAFT_454408 [Entophlyctis helioformis]|nr:hypothetical protein BC831DRAFT_454408 [Entophlyctis helioformis]
MASAAGSDPAQRQQTLLLQPPSAAKPKRQRPPRTPKDPNAPPSAKRQRAKPARTDGSGSSRGYGGIGLPSETGSIISMAEAAGSVSVSVSMSAAVSSTSRGVTDADALASSHRSRPAAQHLLPSSSLVGQHRRAPSAGDHDLDDLLVWSSAEDEDDGVSAAGSGPGFRAKYKALQKDMKGLAHRKQIVEANYRHFKSKLRRLKMEKNFLIDSLMRLHPSQ